MNEEVSRINSTPMEEWDHYEYMEFICYMEYIT